MTVKGINTLRSKGFSWTRIAARYGVDMYELCRFVRAARNRDKLNIRRKGAPLWHLFHVV